MRMHCVSTRTVVTMLLGVSLLLLSGCGEDEERKAPKARSRDRSSQVAALNARLERLEDRLNQLDRELETQRNLQHNQIAAAREDVGAIRDTLSAYGKTLARTGRTTETLVVVREAHEDHEEEEEERGAFTTLLLLAFIGFLIYFGAKILRDKANAEDEASPSSPEQGTSYVYYSKETGTEGLKDKPMEPPSGEKPESPA